MKLPTPPWLAVRQGQGQGQGRGQGQGDHATDAGALLVHKGCWHLLDIALSCAVRRRAKECSAHDTGTLFTSSCQYGQPDIFNTFAWHWNGLFASPFKPILTQNDIIIHLDYIFSQSICSKGINQQAEWRDIQQACYGLCCVICLKSRDRQNQHYDYGSYEHKSWQGVANVKSAVVCVWHLIKDVVSSHHQQPDTIIADVIRIDKYLPGGAILQK